MNKLSKVFISSLFTLWVMSISNVFANVADDLTANYNNIVNNCGSAGRPAFLCSGVMIRVTSPSIKYHVWDPSPRSINGGGVSFSYLRKDAKLEKLLLDKKSGVIFYPSSLKPETKERSEVLCYFPVDAGTSDRTGDGFCEASIEYPNNSGNCQSQNIYDADAWLKHYTSVPDGGYRREFHQCGFNVRIGAPKSSSVFMEGLKAQNSLYGNGLVNPNNEIIIRTWKTENGKTVSPEKLPIQAFFYLDSNGLVEAKYYQKDYFEQTKILIPIVKVTFPENGIGDVKFTYSEADQSKYTCTLD